MKILFIIIVFIHGLIHLAGFIKAFDIKEITDLTLPVSRVFGIIWLMAAMLFLLYGFAAWLNWKYAWLAGIIAVIVSQTLIILFWQDARLGTLLNLVMLTAAVVTWGDSKFIRFTEKERAEILSGSKNRHIEVLSEAAVSDLPHPVKKWLKNSGAVGHTKTINGKITQKARMKMKPDQKNWYDATAIQYTVVDEPSFIWTVRLKMNPLMWIRGRDKFHHGKGEMRIKLNALVNVVSETGEKIDEGSLQRFLGEMVWFPSLAVSPFVQWEEIDDLSAQATMTYKNTTGSGTFFFNENGEFVEFKAMRYQGNDPAAERKEWILTVDDYRVFEGIKIPSKMKATWRLDAGDWTWLKLEITNIEYNITGRH